MDGKKQYIDMTGKRFGYLTVLRRDGTYKKTKQAAWLCRCHCGKEWRVQGYSLRSGDTTSCGCARGGKVKHGMAKSPLFAVWQSMKARCENPKNHTFERYGGRGISVCPRWQVFTNFVADMAPRPDGMTIERIDNDGNYEPENCRWATRKEQANNTRRNRVFQTTLGRMTIAQIADRTGLTVNAVNYRIKRGLTGDALLAPRRQGWFRSTI